MTYIECSDDIRVESSAVWLQCFHALNVNGKVN